MKRIACLAALLTIGLSAGCVERRFIVYSDPPRSLVYVNGNYRGPSPADGYLIYYGKQQIKLIKEGYEDRNVVQEYPAPWYDLPGIDFITENLWPWKLRDVRQFCYTMRPLHPFLPTMSAPGPKSYQRGTEHRRAGSAASLGPSRYTDAAAGRNVAHAAPRSSTACRRQRPLNDLNSSMNS